VAETARTHCSDRELVFSPDGKHLYFAGDPGNALAVYAVDAGTGLLSFVERITDGDGSVTELAGACAVAVSPDGLHVYVAAKEDDAVTVFGRDGSTGELTWIAHLKDGNGGVDGLDGATSIVGSPDGANLYVASDVDDALVVLVRNEITGGLTFLEKHDENSLGVGGVLNSARALTVSDDGQNVYALGAADGTLVVFVRDGSTGALTFLEGFDGPIGSEAIVVPPDGKHLYIGSILSGIARFGRDELDGTLTILGPNLPSVNPLSLSASADGTHVWEADIVLTQGLHRDPATGGLTEPIGLFFVPVGRDPLAATLHPLTGNIYQGASGTVAVFVPEPDKIVAGLAALLALGMLARLRRREVE
jgi:MYXO-CTERM domain-containing protein